MGGGPLSLRLYASRAPPVGVQSNPDRTRQNLVTESRYKQLAARIFQPDATVAPGTNSQLACSARNARLLIGRVGRMHMHRGSKPREKAKFQVPVFYAVYIRTKKKDLLLLRRNIITYR